MSKKSHVGKAAAALVTASVLVLSGCSADGNGTNNGGNEDGKLRDIEITVTQWPALSFSIPYQVGIEKGCFEEHGINITGVVATEGGGTTIRSLLAGDLAFGEAAVSAVASSFVAGAPLVAVGGGVQRVGEIMWAAPLDSELDSIKDLEGHKVAFANPGSVTQSVLALSLEAAGVDRSKVEEIAAGGVGAGLTALDGGAVDSSITVDVIQLANPKHKILWNASDYIAEYQQTFIVTSPEIAKNDPKLVEDFLAARACGIQYTYDHPDEASRIWSEQGDLDLDVAKEALTALLANDHFGVGITAAGLAAAEEGIYEAGVLERGTEIPWNEIVDQSFLPEGVEVVTLP